MVLFTLTKTFCVKMILLKLLEVNRVGFFAFLWGFAEATVFFIIPDVLLTYIAITQKNKVVVIRLLLLTLLGALAGGTVVYMTAQNHPDYVEEILMRVPSVQTYMLEHVINAMNSHPFIGLISGPLFGVPYKLFAYAAPHYMTIWMFIICSIPARLFRFIIVTTLAYYLSHHIFKQLKHATKIIIWLIVWIIVYIIYFGIHGL